MITSSEVLTPINLCDAITYSDFENQLDENTESGKKNAFNKIKEFYSSLTIYGSIEYPLFLESEVRDKLGLTQRIRRRNLNSRGLVMILAKSLNGSIREQKALTESGLYQTLGSSNSDLANDWYDLIYSVFHQLRLNGQVRLKQIVANHDVEMNALTKYIDDTNKKFKAYKVKATLDLQEQKQITYQAEDEKHRTYGKLKQLENEIDIRQIIRNDPDYNSNINQFTLGEVKKAYMFPIYVYVVNITNHKEKYNNYNLDDYDPLTIEDMEGDILRYIFTRYPVFNFPNNLKCKLVKKLYMVEPKTRILTDKLRDNQYVKCIRNQQGGKYLYHIFEVTMCLVEDILSKLNKDLINIRIRLNDEKYARQRDERIKRDQLRQISYEQREKKYSGEKLNF